MGTFTVDNLGEISQLFDISKDSPRGEVIDMEKLQSIIEALDLIQSNSDMSDREMSALISSWDSISIMQDIDMLTLLFSATNMFGNKCVDATLTTEWIAKLKKVTKEDDTLISSAVKHVYSKFFDEGTIRELSNVLGITLRMGNPKASIEKIKETVNENFSWLSKAKMINETLELLGGKYYLTHVSIIFSDLD